MAQQTNRIGRDAALALCWRDPIADARPTFLDRPQADRAEETVCGSVGDRQGAVVPRGPPDTRLVDPVMGVLPSVRVGDRDPAPDLGVLAGIENRPLVPSRRQPE